jgi:hypothetical protein
MNDSGTPTVRPNCPECGENQLFTTTASSAGDNVHSFCRTSTSVFCRCPSPPSKSWFARTAASLVSSPTTTPENDSKEIRSGRGSDRDHPLVNERPIAHAPGMRLRTARRHSGRQQPSTCRLEFVGSSAFPHSDATGDDQSHDRSSPIDHPQCRASGRLEGRHEAERAERRDRQQEQRRDDPRNQHGRFGIQ